MLGTRRRRLSLALGSIGVPNMGNPKGPSEGGSGGKRGHSNMEHSAYTVEVKRAARKRRRLDSRKLVQLARKDHESSDRTTELKGHK